MVAPITSRPRTSVSPARGLSSFDGRTPGSVERYAVDENLHKPTESDQPLWVPDRDGLELIKLLPAALLAWAVLITVLVWQLLSLPSP